MNKLKTYEKFFELKYNIGDYIKFKKNIFAYPYAKIVNTNSLTTTYKVEMFFFDKLIIGWINEDQIERKLNSEEIERFDLRLMTNKYNI
jgi:hypothetical protein